MPEKRKISGQGKGCDNETDFDARWDKQAKVSFRVYLPKETLDLLRDVSMARAIYDLAASVKVNKRGPKFRQPSVSKVLAEMIEERRPALEREVEIVRGISENEKLEAANDRETTEY